MITLRKIIYDIRGLIRDARSNDLHFTDRQIAFWVNTLRNKLIKERLDKGQVISDNNYQHIESLPLKTNSEFTGKDLDIDLDCIIMSTGILPNMIQHNDMPLISQIRGRHYKSTISILPKPQAIRVKNNKYTRNLNVAYYEDHRIYLLGGSSYMEDIYLEALFEDPDEANKLITGEKLGMDEEYPVDSNLIDVIKEIILTKNLNIYLNLPEDKVNNAETEF